MSKAALYNLRCKVNTYEAEAMQQQLKEHGYEIVSFDQKAGVCIINTCSVTNVAGKGSRQMLHRAKRMNPDSVVAVAGCYAQVTVDILEKDGCVDTIIRNNQKAQLAQILGGYLEGRKDSRTHILDIDRINECESIQVSKISDHSRTFVRAQDEYNQLCSYCIIPCARGRVRSRNPEDVVGEMKGPVARGCKEVVLARIRLSSYGIEHLSDDPVRGGGWDHTALLDLILRIHEIPGLEQIRPGSLEPRIIIVGFVGILAGLSKFRPRFHLSLQSGCSETLERMNRHYATQGHMERYNILKSCFDHPAITTDVIVGFPGEAQEEFTTTRELLEQVHFSEMHVSKYSRYRGTRVADMPDQVPEPTKAARNNVFLDLEAAMSEEYREWLIGGQVSVLFEEMTEVEGNIYMVGHTPQHMKAVLAVNGPEGDELQGTIYTLKVVGLLGSDLLQVVSS